MKWGIFKSIRFEMAKKKVSKRGGNFSTHGCAVDLKVVTREAFLISKGRTLLPHGLNIREEIY